jgi:hypothetical protein
MCAESKETELSPSFTPHNERLHGRLRCMAVAHQHKVQSPMKEPILQQASCTHRTRQRHFAIADAYNVPRSHTKTSSHDLFTGPLTPAPITDGSSWSPISHTVPTAKPTRKISAIVNSAIIQNSTLTSFFWHAGPPQYVVFVLPSLVFCDEAEHWQV